MTSAYLVLKLAHILSATVLFGTGLGTAFQMWAANRSGDARTIADAAATVVKADVWFTTPAVIVQPLTGLALVHLAGFGLRAPWLVAAYLLYLLAGACWLPVVWIQLRMRDLARQALLRQAALPALYHRLFRVWFLLGWPAFGAVLGIFWLMVTKPDL
jgi:uncharacterized membrane protein